MKLANNYLKFTFLQLVVLLMPLLILNVKHAASEILILILTIFGAYFSIKERTMPVFHNQLKLYSCLVWAFFISVALSVVLSNNPLEGINHIGSNIHFLVAPFMAYGIHKSDITLKQIVSVIKFSIVIGTIFAVYQFHYLGFSRSEAGAHNPNIFGFIMVIFSFFSIINIWKEHTTNKLFSLLFFLLGTYSIILSGARIAYLMFIVLIPVIMLLWATTGQLTKKI